jgi:hypothetical protein
MYGKSDNLFLEKGPGLTSGFLAPNELTLKETVKQGKKKKSSNKRINSTLTKVKEISSENKKLGSDSSSDEFINYIMRKGIEFENSVIEYLKQRNPDCVVTIAHGNQSHDTSKAKETYDAMCNGVPIIYQAVLYNDEDKTYGMPDLLIRSDWLNKIFLIDAIDEKEIHIHAPFLKNIKGEKYHYRVIDIKWSTLRLRADGKHILNIERYPAYKGQLYIYTQALGKMQGYTPSICYILGRKWMYESMHVKYSGSNRFERLGVINFDGVDKEYSDKVNNAVEWIKELRKNGSAWKLLPPSREELYPNMANYNDGIWHNVKEKLANDLKEITSLWMCGPKNRKLAHSAGVYRWNDPNCNTNVLGIKGDIQAPIIEQILEVNTDKHANVLPDVVLNNDNNWQKNSKLEFFIDIEFITEIFMEDIFSQLGKDTKFENFTFLIGLGYVVNKKWNYTAFVAKDLTLASEKEIYINALTFIKKKTEEVLGEKATVPNIYHWSSAETQYFNSVANKYGKQGSHGPCSSSVNSNFFSDLLKGTTWVDILKIFKDEPIAVKGCLKYGLKNIGTAMYNLGYIKTVWDKNDCNNGKLAMLNARKCYDISQKNGVIVVNMEQMKNIVKYTEKDCKVPWEILCYLRKHHCSEKKFLDNGAYKDSDDDMTEYEPINEIESNNEQTDDDDDNNNEEESEEEIVLTDSEENILNKEQPGPTEEDGVVEL